MTYPARISYAFMLLVFVFAVWLHLATPLITVLFSVFALHVFAIRGKKWLAVTLFVILLGIVGLGFWLFFKEAAVAFPNIANTTIPMILSWAEKQGIELPFTDYASLKDLALTSVSHKLANLGRYAQTAVIEIAEFLIGVVVAISLFLNSRIDLDTDKPAATNNLYTVSVNQIAERFKTFFRSFATVMGAQIIISGINTVLTGVFLVWNQFPFSGVIIVVTFLCGLLPIIGNLLSNTLIVGVGFTISPHMALMALVFLVVLHKLEYFLNSKIIGDRIRNPMWLTLLGLVIGEKLMGVPGMILAPVILHYIKVEMKRARVARQEDGEEKIVRRDDIPDAAPETVSAELGSHSPN